MELNTLRMVVEVIAFLSFLAIVAWAWSARNRDRFEEAARLPFDGDPGRESAVTGQTVAKAPSRDIRGDQS